MTRRLDTEQHGWMNARATRAVMQALGAREDTARFVGGAVRNSLLGREVGDIDIATPLRPEEVIRRLQAARIAAVPTGLAHGTVTAIVQGKSFEVTTLRRDVSTDGRRATVAFSESWQEDAQRRDFTQNALYASEDGELFDYTGGLQDLDARRIRFIGNPVARIREDYLRILRLFRFQAWYGEGEIDADALAAARAEREGLRHLSGERIQSEMLRLLQSEHAAPAIRTMAEAEILGEIVAGDLQIARLEHLVAIETGNFFAADALLRLSALTPSNSSAADAVARRLRLSNESRERLIDLAGAREELSPGLAPAALRPLVYRLGPKRIQDRILLGWAADKDESRAIGWRALLAIATAWTPPRLPISGADVIAAGVPEGPQVGRVLAVLEAWWIAQDFVPDRSTLAKQLRAIAKNQTA